MGNTFSDNSQNSNIGHRARKMLNVRPGSNHTDHQTIKFSRGDLVNTVSSLDLNSVFEQHGGSKNIDLHNIPSRNRYDDYTTTTKIKHLAGGSRGVIGAVSSSNGDLSIIKNMIMGTQAGGSYGNSNTVNTQKSANCGCETNEVLQDGGKLDLASLLLLQNNLNSASTSYNPLNSMTPLHGGSLDLTSDSSTLNILTDSPIMAGGANNNSRRMFSATSPFTETHNGLTATSPFNQSQMNQYGGGLLSSTSYSDNQNFSATSTFNQSNNQFGGALSATSTFNQSQNNQFGGALSATSTMPINYDNLIGGKNKNKKEKSKAKIVKRSSASSSSTKSTSISSISRTSNPSSTTIMNDMDDSSESTASESESNEGDIIARALKSDHHENEIRRDLSRLTSDKDTKKQNKQGKKSSDSSSSTMSGSTSTNETSKSGSSSATTLSSSETPNEAIAKVGMARFNNILLTSPNNDTVSDSLINAKQFYSSDHGDLYSSSSNFLRNNINKNRLR
jgi:hypothetical protein